MVEDLNTLYYFTQVVEHHGFAAGRALDMPKSKLSRRISELEERLGVRLLHRTSRHCSLTEIGQAYSGGNCRRWRGASAERSRARGHCRRARRGADSGLGTEVRRGACDLSVATRVVAVGAYVD